MAEIKEISCDQFKPKLSSTVNIYAICSTYKEYKDGFSFEKNIWQSSPTDLAVYIYFLLVALRCRYKQGDIEMYLDK